MTRSKRIPMTVKDYNLDFSNSKSINYYLNDTTTACATFTGLISTNISITLSLIIKYENLKFSSRHLFFFHFDMKT